MESLSWWPYALGSPLQGGMFVAFLVVAVRTSPAWLMHFSTMRLAKSNANAARITELERQVKDCYDECSGVKREAADTASRIQGEHAEAMRLLNERLLGEQRQRIQEQMSLINAILRSVDSPELKKVLGTLESVQIAIKPEDTSTMKAAKATENVAAQTHASATETRKEVKRSEDKQNGDK